MNYDISEPYEQALNDIAAVIHESNNDAGWWDDLYLVEDLIRDSALPYPEQAKIIPKVRLWFRLSKVALIHSEISEMVEGMRKGLADTHLPHRGADEVEAADTLIRLLDLCGQMGLDIGGATGEKFMYNQERADHKPENRAKDGGKLV